MRPKQAETFINRVCALLASAGYDPDSVAYGSAEESVTFRAMVRARVHGATVDSCIKEGDEALYDEIRAHVLEQTLADELS